MSLIKHILVLAGRIFISGLARSSYKEKVISKYRNQPLTVIKTFAYHFTQFDDFKDPIFQDLSQILKDNNQPVLTIYEPVNVFRKSIREKDLGCSTLSYYDLIKFSDILRIGTHLIFSFLKEIRIKEVFVFQGKDISKEFKRLYLFEHFSPSTFHSMSYFFAIKNLCTLLQVKKFIYTYENNSWERMCLMSFRQFSEKTKLIAYQHNVIPLASANMFLGKDEENHSPIPDVILTTGQKPLDILRVLGNFNTIKLKSTCAIRYKYLEQISPVSRNNDKPTLLIALEGVWQAAEIMNAIFAQANQFSHWKVIVRTHQVLGYEKLSLRIHYNIKDHPNFELSSGKTLTQDIEESTTVLYWGSSVALEAIKFGKPLINIKLSAEIDFDPLFEVTALKASWSPNEDISTYLDEILRMDEGKYQDELHTAQEYLSSYFHPVTLVNLNPFLEDN